MVNGEPRSVVTEDDTPLLYVLRNHLGLKGTRFGCGLGLCGACFVLINGAPQYSCDTPMWSLGDSEVITVEGLGSEGNPNPVARALINEQAAQCGFCISGIMIAATALIEDNDNPTEKQIREGLDRNLCRCGAHNRIVRAVRAAAASARTHRDGCGDVNG